MELQANEPRRIFVDVYTDWCGWCKKMDKGTFTDSNIVRSLNTYYYPVKFNAEKGDTIVFNGQVFSLVKSQNNRSIHTLAASLLDNQLSYPSFVILDANMKRLMIMKGYQQPDPLNGLLLFFATDQHLRYIQYLNYEQQRSSSAQ